MEKETIELMKRMIEDGNLSEEVAMKYCPELKESEDERIRKELIEYFRWNVKQILNDFSNKECIAWLEKHRYTDIALENEYWRGYNDAKKEKGEHEPVEFKPSFRVGDVIKPKDPVLGEPRIIVGIHLKLGYETNNGILDFEFEDNWELVEQKPVDKAEPKFKVGDVMRTIQEAADGIKDGMPVVVSIDEEYYHCNNELIAIKDQDSYEYPPINRRQKTAWSEDDETMITDLSVIVHTYFSEISGIPFKYDLSEDKIRTWLKSLKERVQQPKQEWSEEDDKMINSIAVHLNATTGGFPEERAWADRFMNWLKSLTTY